MFVGHLAAGLAAKKIEPEVPLGAAVAAAFGLDLVWPILLLLGVEVVHVQPHDTAFTHLTFVSYPWSHSFLMVAIWSALTAGAARWIFASWRVGAMLGALVMSHWILDFISHRPDLPLWPDGPVAGLGLWYSIPLTILVEGSLLALGVWLYTSSTTARDRTGRWALIGLLALTTTIWVTQPWSPPPPSSMAVAWGALVLWLIPPWAGWIEAHRRRRS